MLRRCPPVARSWIVTVPPGVATASVRLSDAKRCCVDRRRRALEAWPTYVAGAAFARADWQLSVEVVAHFSWAL